MGTFKDLVGKRFGRLAVISQCEEIRSGYDHRKRIKWLCKCECGGFAKTYTWHLTSGKTKSCGCINREYNKSKLVDLTGKKFGRLRVIRRVENRKQITHWLCKCECGSGEHKIVSGSHLKKGGIRSCGCLSRENYKSFSKLCSSRTREKHQRWDKSKTKEEREENRNNSKCREFSKKIFIRDNFICFMCGKKSKRLNAHHIESWHSAIDKRFDTNNCVTLCPRCHTKFHMVYGYKTNSLEQLDALRRKFKEIDSA